MTFIPSGVGVTGRGHVICRDEAPEQTVHNCSLTTDVAAGWVPLLSDLLPAEACRHSSLLPPPPQPTSCSAPHHCPGLQQGSETHSPWLLFTHLQCGAESGLCCLARDSVPASLSWSVPLLLLGTKRQQYRRARASTAPAESCACGSAPMPLAATVVVQTQCSRAFSAP